MSSLIAVKMRMCQDLMQRIRLNTVDVLRREKLTNERQGAGFVLVVLSVNA